MIGPGMDRKSVGICALAVPAASTTIHVVVTSGRERLIRPPLPRSGDPFSPPSRRLVHPSVSPRSAGSIASDAGRETLLDARPHFLRLDRGHAAEVTLGAGLAPVDRARLA